MPSRKHENASLVLLAIIAALTLVLVIQNILHRTPAANGQELDQGSGQMEPVQSTEITGVLNVGPEPHGCHRWVIWDGDAGYLFLATVAESDQMRPYIGQTIKVWLRRGSCGSYPGPDEVFVLSSFLGPAQEDSKLFLPILSRHDLMVKPTPTPDYGRFSFGYLRKGDSNSCQGEVYKQASCEGGGNGPLWLDRDHVLDGLNNKYVGLDGSRTFRCDGRLFIIVDEVYENPPNPCSATPTPELETPGPVPRLTATLTPGASPTNACPGQPTVPPVTPGVPTPPCPPQKVR